MCVLEYEKKKNLVYRKVDKNKIKVDKNKIKVDNKVDNKKL